MSFTREYFVYVSLRIGLPDVLVPVLERKRDQRRLYLRIRSSHIVESLFDFRDHLPIEQPQWDIDRADAVALATVYATSDQVKRPDDVPGFVVLE
jgi:hypothetical protein